MRILDLIDLNRGETLKQGDSTLLRFQIADRDQMMPDRAGEQARVVFMYNNSIMHEELTVVQTGNIVEFSISEVLPPNVYSLEIHVGGQIFPSDEFVFKITRSALNAEHNIIKLYGVDNIVDRAVDEVSGKFVELTKEKLDLGNVINVRQASEMEVSDLRSRLDETTAQLAEMVVNVKKFGATGDGVTDDYLPIQNAIDYAFENGGGQVFLPPGNYIISKPLVLYGGRNYIDRGVTLIGENMIHTKITKNNHNTLDDSSVHAKVDAIIILAPSSDSLTVSYNQKIEDIWLNGLVSGDDYVEYAIYSHKKLGTSHTSRVTINQVQKGLHFYSGLWQSSFSKIFIACSINGFYIDVHGDGSTSNSLDAVYVQGAKGVAFRLAGVYSAASNLAADNCTGIVYDFYFSQWTVDGIGMESSAETGVKVHVSDVILTSFTALGMHKQNSTLFDVSSNSTLTVVNPLIDHSPHTIDGFLYKTGTTKSLISIKNMNTKNTYLQQKEKTKSGFVDISSVQSTPMTFRWGHVSPFLGHDRNTNPFLDFWNETPKMKGKAIFLDAQGSPNMTHDDVYIGWSPAVNVGDVFIENDPQKNGVFAHVCTDKGVYLRDCSFAKVQIVSVGDVRPASPFVGFEHKDTTLKKTITWYGDNWYDEGGNIV